MKKLIALLMAICCCAGAVSCSQKKEKQPDNLVAEQMKAAYKRSIIETPEALRQIYTFKTYNGGEKIFILGFGDTVPEFYTVDTGFESFSLLEIPDFDIGVSYDLDINNDGVIVSIVNYADYGDLPEPDFSSPDYDEALYDQNAEYTLKINTYSIEGELLSSEPLKSFPVTPDKSTITSGVVSDGTTAIVDINGTYYVVKTDGTYVGELTSDMEGYKIREFGKDSEGNLVCAMINFDDDKLQLCRVNPDTGKAEPSDIVYSFAETVSSEVLPGTGDYKMFITTMTTVYGIRADDSSIEPVFSLIDSGLNSNNIGGFYLEEDGNVVIPDNGDMLSLKLRRYTQCDPAELEGIPTITIGVLHEGWFLPDYVAELNDTQTDFRAELKVYDMEYSDAESYNQAMDSFTEDALAGNLPDIMLLDQYNRFNDVYMDEMGVLCDLNEFIDKDTELTRDNLIPNILELMETDGKLCSISNHFAVYFGDVIKTKFAGDIEKWDYSAYIDTIMNVPEGMRLYENMLKDSKLTRWGNVPIEYFVDWENATCSFDSPEFIELLKFCNEPDNLMDDTDYLNMTEEEQTAEYVDQFTSIREDRALLADYVNFGIYESYLNIKEGQFGGEDMTILGFPTKNGGECYAGFHERYAITETSENKELAWQFIKTLFTDEYYKNNTVSHGNGSRYSGSFPVTYSGLEILEQNECVPRNNSNYVKDPTYTGIFYQAGNEGIPIGSITPEIVAEVNDIIYSLDKTEPRGSYDSDLWIIIEEERDRFFAGECTAEACAEAIQSRASICIAEKS